LNKIVLFIEKRGKGAVRVPQSLLLFVNRLELNLQVEIKSPLSVRKWACKTPAPKNHTGIPICDDKGTNFRNVYIEFDTFKSQIFPSPPPPQ
jgi:hypothetical protein